MTVRECYKCIALFKKAAYIPNFEGGFSMRTIRQWWKEGMPEGMHPHQFFHIDCVELVRDISYAPIPGVGGQYQSLDQYKPLLEPLGYEVAYDATRALVARKDGREFYIGHNAWGCVRLYLKPAGPEDDAAEAGFVHIRGALQSADEWAAIRDQFKPDIAVRYGDERSNNRWAGRVARWKGHEHVLVLEAPSMVGGIAHEMGFENYCIQLYENRPMVEELMDARTDLAVGILDRAISEVDFDMLWFWEDMAFRNGPYMSPKMFEELCVPRYRRLADWYHSRGGEIVAVDSDGDVRELIPGWIRGGINHIWPFEAFAGMDVVAMRKEYGQAFSMRGGMDKFCVSKGRDAIDRELDRVCPVVQDGGYIPHLDHMLPHAPFEDYCYYMEQKQKLLGKSVAGRRNGFVKRER